MLIGILGDIHGNLDALDTVVAAMRRDGVEEWVQVGDIVGYGPEPSACIHRVQELGCTVCLGNHDAAVVGRLDTSYFNNYARTAVEWTMGQISDEERDWLAALPLLVQKEHYTVVHGTLHMPEEFGYVLSTVEAKDSLRLQQSFMCFVGHSHAPAIYMERPEMQPNEIDVLFLSEVETNTRGCSKVLMNVGSVGQPRDEDSRAAYALFDTETRSASIRRVDYDIGSVQRKIRDAGLPDVLASRLSMGI